MSIYLKFSKLLIIIVGVFFLVGCEPEEETDKETKKDTPSQTESSSSSSNTGNSNGQTNTTQEEGTSNLADTNQESSDDSVDTTDDSSQNNNASSENEEEDNNEPTTNDSSSTFEDRTKSYTTYAERQLVIDIDVPVAYDIEYAKIESINHGLYRGSKINKKEKKLYYIPNNGYIGKDEIKVAFRDKHYENKIMITYKIDIQKPSLEKNRDFVISFRCEDISKHLTSRGYIKNYDVSIIDDDLTLLENVYDDKGTHNSNYKVPKQSKMVSDHYLLRWNTKSQSSLSDEKSIRHHNIFNNHTNNNMVITCNYPNGYFNLIYPLDGEEWYAIKPYNDHSLTFSRNDLYFYVSSLSELHSKIYLKEYKNGESSKESYQKANKFMDKIFPNSHYTAELAHNYNYKTNKYDGVNTGKKFDSENKFYYDKITFLADEITKGDILLLLQKIADNYESYYMSDNHQCLDSTICGILFPEYTKLVTSNSKFENGLDSWDKREELASPAQGKIEAFPTQNVVNIEYTVNRNKSSDNPSSNLDLYQTEQLNQNNIDDYFLRFDLNDIYGGSDGGFPAYAGLLSSGFAGVYACYNNHNNKNIGCMAWSDHTNKFDIAWGPVENSIESSDTFNNTRLNNVIRRVRPNGKFGYTIHLGEYMKKYLPEIYKRKNEIKSIEYGLFATEFRSKQNECYNCTAKIKANEISLLKVQ